VRGTKERSFSGKFTGDGAGKTEPDSSGWKREAAASRINQKRATRVKPSRPYFFVAMGEKGKRARSANASGVPNADLGRRPLQGQERGVTLCQSSERETVPTE